MLRDSIYHSDLSFSRPNNMQHVMMSLTLFIATLVWIGSASANTPKMIDSVVVRTMAEEVEVPLKGLLVKLRHVETGMEEERLSNEHGIASFAVGSSKRFTLTVNGITIGSKENSEFLMPAVGDHSEIVLQFSKAELKEARDRMLRSSARLSHLDSLRGIVSNADAYKVVRGFLDSILVDEVVVGEKVEFVSGKSGQRQVLVSDNSGMVFFKGADIGLQNGDRYIVKGISGGSTNSARVGGAPSWEFVFSGRDFPNDWDGGYGSAR